MNKQQLAAKNFLMQAYRVDIRINNKLEQIMALNELARKTSGAISDMPGSPNRNIHKMEDVVVRIIDMQAELKNDMIELMNVKEQTTDAIKSVADPELQTVLELRYLSYLSWEQIALELDYGIDNVFKLHRKALDNVCIPETVQ